MKICEYGCGREGKFYFKTPGKWCCESHWSRCPAKRKENSIRKEKEWEDPDSEYNSDSCRKKKSETLKELWEDPGSEYNLISWKEKQSKAKKLTIEKIQQKYKTFYSEEEMRYNPDKLEEKEIQVHCKNHNCLNSKEKDGWFTPTYIQISERRSQLEKQDGNDGCFLYCSQYCKDTCPCYNVINDPFQLAEFEQYNREVWKYTNLTLKYNSNKILNVELRGNKHGYDLDHKFSILDGFNNDIDPALIGHWKNLEAIKASDNRTKSGNSSISLEEIQNIKILPEEVKEKLHKR